MNAISGEKLRIISLGGKEEVGNNMIVIEYEKYRLILDCGILFPDETMPGISYLVPDFSYLKDDTKEVSGIILSHGHEDHIGGLPHLLEEINCPIYGTRFTLGLVTMKLKNSNAVKEVRLLENSPGESFSTGPFKVHFYRVTHSIPDSVAMVIETPAGNVLYTGDYKLDQSPIDNQKTDLAGLASWHNRIKVMLGDSTNSELEGTSLSEKVIQDSIEDIVALKNKRLIFATFSSHIHRIQQVFWAAEKAGRKVAVDGKSMQNSIELASQLGYLKYDPKLLIDIEDASKLPDEKVILVMTGSQGETMASLTRLARSEHRQIEIHPGDTVFISASPIPGNEKSVGKTINLLYRKGARVIYDGMLDVHATGHARQEEIKTMINLIKPEFLIPVHGEYRQIYHHSLLALQTGMKEDQILLTNNGDIIEISDDNARVTGKVPAGYVYIDAQRQVHISEVVLNDRRELGEKGFLTVILTIDQKGRVLAQPEIISRGFVYLKKSTSFLEEIKKLVLNAADELREENIKDWKVWKSTIYQALEKYLFENEGGKPMLLPVVIQVQDDR